MEMYAPPHREPRAVIIAPSLVPAFWSSSSNILSFPGLYEDLIFPCVSCQASLLVKFLCFLHGWLFFVLQTHSDVSWGECQGPAMVSSVLVKMGSITCKDYPSLCLCLAFKRKFRIWSNVCFIYHFFIPNSRLVHKVWDLENHLGTAL